MLFTILVTLYGKIFAFALKKLNLVQFDILGEYFSSTDVPSGKWQIYI